MIFNVLVLLLVAVGGTLSEPPGQSFTAGAVIRFPPDDDSHLNQQPVYKGVQGLQYYATGPNSAQALSQLYHGETANTAYQLAQVGHNENSHAGINLNYGSAHQPSNDFSLSPGNAYHPGSSFGLNQPSNDFGLSSDTVHQSSQTFNQASSNDFGLNPGPQNNFHSASYPPTQQHHQSVQIPSVDSSYLSKYPAQQFHHQTLPQNYPSNPNQFPPSSLSNHQQYPTHAFETSPAPFPNPDQPSYQSFFMNREPNQFQNNNQQSGNEQFPFPNPNQQTQHYFPNNNQNSVSSLHVYQNHNPQSENKPIPFPIPQQQNNQHYSPNQNQNIPSQSQYLNSNSPPNKKHYLPHPSQHEAGQSVTEEHRQNSQEFIPNPTEPVHYQTVYTNPTTVSTHAPTTLLTHAPTTLLTRAPTTLYTRAPTTITVTHPSHSYQNSDAAKTPSIPQESSSDPIDNVDLTYHSIGARRPVHRHPSPPPMKAFTYGPPKAHNGPYSFRKPSYVHGRLGPNPPKYNKVKTHPSSHGPAIYGTPHNVRNPGVRAPPKYTGNGGMTKVIYHKPESYNTITNDMLGRLGQDGKDQRYSGVAGAYNGVKYNKYHRSSVEERQPENVEPDQTGEKDSSHAHAHVQKAPVIVYKGMRPPVSVYQKPQLTSIKKNPGQYQQHYEPVKEAEVARTVAPVITPAPSSWVPINAPEGAVPARAYNIQAPDLSRSDSKPSYEHLKTETVRGIPHPDHILGRHESAQNYPRRPEIAEHKFPRRPEMTERRIGEGGSSEEVVSAVVLVKQK